MDKDPGNTGEHETKKEVERKFLLHLETAYSVIIENDLEPSSIYQAYLVVTDDNEERVRRTINADDDVSYTRTVKSSGDMVRDEDEEPISEAAFIEALSGVVGEPIEKLRYSIQSPLNSEDIIEIDIYSGSLTGLVVAEIEFDGATLSEAIEKAESFDVPEWIDVDEEVTKDKRFKNKSLAVNGLPE